MQFQWLMLFNYLTCILEYIQKCYKKRYEVKHSPLCSHHIAQNCEVVVHFKFTLFPFNLLGKFPISNMSAIYTGTTLTSWNKLTTNLQISCGTKITFLLFTGLELQETYFPHNLLMWVLSTDNIFSNELTT